MTATAQQSAGGSVEAGRLAAFEPVLRRLRTEVGGAGLLLAATVLALAWANSPWGGTYETFWHTDVAVRVAGVELALTLQHWINDGLMAFFFFVVGLEVKRELVIGELADRRRAAVPAVAALAGLVVPALVYVAFTLGDPAVGAWGVVISTDTAFVLGVLALLGTACPPQLRVFLLTLAIADDVGALTVIALFYTEDLRLGALALAVAGFGLMLALRWLRVWRGPAYLVLGVGAWVALYLSGVHPTLLGVAVALVTPAYAARRADVEDAARRARAYSQSPDPDAANAARLSIARSVPPAQRLQLLWQPWTTAVVVPLFALANAGVPLTAESLRAAASSPITLGVVAGLVVGKLIGILVGTGVAVGTRLGRLAPGLNALHVAGGAALSGIGFTISLFIVDLALDDEDAANQARTGVLAASLIAALLGSVLLTVAAARLPSSEGRPELLEPPVDPARDHIRGDPDAPLTLVEYGDFECPFCSRATGAVLELEQRFGGRLRYVFRHSPLADVHPHAPLAAEAAEAAGAQGRFWDMHDHLFEHQDRLTSADLLAHADALGLDGARFARDLGGGRYTRRVEQHLESALASGVEGTPTFFVGGRRHTGAHDAASLAAALLAHEPADAGEDAAEAPAHAPRNAGELLDLPADLPETLDRGGDQPRLTDAQLALLERYGTRRAVARGDVLYRAGDDGYDFHVVLSGAVAVYARIPGDDRPAVRVHEGRRFLGALDLFDDDPVARTAQVVRPGEVLRLTVPQLHAAFSADRRLKEVVVRAYITRRALADELRADLRILGDPGAPDVVRLREQVTARGLTADVVDLDDGNYGELLLAQVGASDAELPVVVLRDGRVLHAPDPAVLADALDAAPG